MSKPTSCDSAARICGTCTLSTDWKKDTTASKSGPNSVRREAGNNSSREGEMSKVSFWSEFVFVSAAVLKIPRFGYVLFKDAASVGLLRRVSSKRLICPNGALIGVGRVASWVRRVECRGWSREWWRGVCWSSCWSSFNCGALVVNIAAMTVLDQSSDSQVLLGLESEVEDLEGRNPKLETDK